QTILLPVTQIETGDSENEISDVPTIAEIPRQGKADRITDNRKSCRHDLSVGLDRDSKSLVTAVIIEVGCHLAPAAKAGVQAPIRIISCQGEVPVRKSRHYDLIISLEYHRSGVIETATAEVRGYLASAAKAVVQTTV